MTTQDWIDHKNAKDCHICDKSLAVDTYRHAIDGFHPNTGKHKGSAHKKCYFQSPTIIGSKAKRKPKGDDTDICYICDKSFIKKNGRDCIRDHCHITGRYRGAAHNACNIQMRLSTTIPVVFHNLRGYNSHLLMQAISKVQGNVSRIPNNTEKYISFFLGQLRFIDSVQFLLASLERLVKAHEPDDEKRNLLLRKGIYPYEHMDDWVRFHEPQLSSIEITTTRRRYGRSLDVRPWATITICICVRMYYS